MKKTKLRQEFQKLNGLATPNFSVYAQSKLQELYAMFSFKGLSIFSYRYFIRAHLKSKLDWEYKILNKLKGLS